MTPRTYGDVPQYNSVPGGNPQPRPDQLLQPTSRAGVGPAPASGIVVARKVIVFGPGEGIFIYSGTPALGNLIGSWAGVAGVDQFGNSYPAGLDVAEGSLEVSDIIAQALTLNPGPFLLYGNPNTVQVLLTGSGNWTAPAGVTHVFAECIGAGGGGGSAAGSPGAGAGAGGEYAAEPALAVTPTHLYAYSQGTAGAAGTGGGTGGTGGNTTFAGDSVTVTAHGGGGGSTGGLSNAPGGTGSTNTTHFNGGNGGAGGSGTHIIGGGGGSSAGFSAAGNQGGGSNTGGIGGSAPTGGGNGGNGGAGGSPGSAGGTPGGGGGGSGGGGTPNGGAGSAGWIRLTYVPSGSPVLVASIAASPGTDPATSDSYPGPGLGLNTTGTVPAALSGTSAVFSNTGDQLDYVSGTDGNTYDTGRLTLFATSTLINSTTPINITGLSFNLGVGTYRVRALIKGITAGSGVTQSFTPRINGTSTESQLVVLVQASTLTSAAQPAWGQINAYNADPSNTTGAIGNATTVFWFIEGFVTISAAGTFFYTCRALTSASDETLTVQPSSWAEIMPVVA